MSPLLPAARLPWGLYKQAEEQEEDVHSLLQTITIMLMLQLHSTEVRIRMAKEREANAKGSHQPFFSGRLHSFAFN